MEKREENGSHIGTFFESSDDRDQAMGSSKNLKKMDIKNKNLHGMVPKDSSKEQEELIRGLL